MLFVEQASKLQTKDSITVLPPNRLFVSSSATRRSGRRRERERESESKQTRDSSSSAVTSSTSDKDSESRLCPSRDEIARGFAWRRLPLATTIVFLHLSQAISKSTVAEQDHRHPDKQRARGSASTHKNTRRHHSKSLNRESGSQSVLLPPATFERGIQDSQEDKSYCNSETTKSHEQLAICSAIDDREVAKITTLSVDTVTKDNLLVVEQVLTKKQQDNSDDLNEKTNLNSLAIQLVAIVFSLLAILYLINFIQKIMTNLLSKILGGGGSGSNLDRRRSLASNVNQHQTTNSGQQANAIAQSQSSSTLNLPRNSSSSSSTMHQQTNNSSTLANQSYQQHQRRASRSSVHSLSAMLMSAITGGTNSNLANNGRSIIAKNKEDTVIIASSSPTIIQKESTDSGSSTIVSNSAGGGSSTPLTSSVGSGVSPAVAAALAANAAAAAAAGDTENAELVIVDQNLYDLVRNPLAGFLMGGAGNLDPTAMSLIGQNSGQRISTVCTQQLAFDQVTAATLALAASGSSSAAGSSSQSSSHAPLNATNTMKPSASNSSSSSAAAAAAAAAAVAASTASPRKTTVSNLSAKTSKRNEVIKATELLLNALNLGDYDTYTKLCDPHMTSFEPENLGNLIDNMEYRRFCIDQARQLQFHHLQQQQITHHNQVAIQQAAAAASAAAAAAASASVTFASSSSSSSSSSPANSALQAPATPTKQTPGQAVAGGTSGQIVNQIQLQQIASAAAVAAASAAMANLNLGTSSQQQQPQKSPQNSSNSQASTATTTPTTTTSSNNLSSFSSQLNQLISSPFYSAQTQTNHHASRQYSLMLNPSVYLLGDEAASIAYTKLSQCINLASGQMNIEQSEETRVWHKKDGNKWLCVHLHRSLVNNNNSVRSSLLNTGPQTSASLARLVANQQQLANLAQVHQYNQHLQQHQQQQLQHQNLQQQVPLISLNHSSTGSTSTTNTANSPR